MPILLICPMCQSSLEVPEELAGERVKCGKCSGMLRVPEDAEVTPRGGRGCLFVILLASAFFNCLVCGGAAGLTATGSWERLPWDKLRRTKGADALMVERIEFLYEEADLFATIRDPASLREAQPKLKQLGERMAENEKAWAKLSREQQAEAEKKHQDELTGAVKKSVEKKAAAALKVDLGGLKLDLPNLGKDFGKDLKLPDLKSPAAPTADKKASDVDARDAPGKEAAPKPPGQFEKKPS
jgi:hypothetical protein